MDDREIIALYQARDEAALTETRKRCGSAVRQSIGRILRDPADAEECENDTYLAAWQSIPPAEPVHLTAYLVRIARNTACRRLEYLTAARRNPQVMLSLDELGDTVADGAAAGCGDDALRDVIGGFLDSCKPAHRRAFLLRYWAFASVAEVAAAMGWSESKTVSVLYRTRKKLRAYLEERGYGV